TCRYFAAAATSAAATSAGLYRPAGLVRVEPRLERQRPGDMSGRLRLICVRFARRALLAGAIFPGEQVLPLHQDHSRRQLSSVLTQAFTAIRMNDRKHKSQI